jgi:hypothetical protein
MPRRSKTDVNKIRESLQTICTQCGYSISPIDLVRLDNERVRCPKCGKEFNRRRGADERFFKGSLRAFAS